VTSILLFSYLYQPPATVWLDRIAGHYRGNSQVAVEVVRREVGGGRTALKWYWNGRDLQRIEINKNQYAVQDKTGYYEIDQLLGRYHMAPVFGGSIRPPVGAFGWPALEAYPQLLLSAPYLDQFWPRSRDQIQVTPQQTGAEILVPIEVNEGVEIGLSVHASGRMEEVRFRRMVEGREQRWTLVLTPIEWPGAAAFRPDLKGLSPTILEPSLLPLGPGAKLPSEGLRSPSDEVASLKGILAGRRGWILVMDRDDPAGIALREEFERRRKEPLYTVRPGRPRGEREWGLRGALSDWAPSGTPALYWCDPDGRIRAAWFGYHAPEADRLFAEIEEATTSRQ